MKLSKTALNTDSLQQTPESVVYETQASEYMIDCYPYAVRGFMWGLFFSIILWGILIGAAMLML